MNNRTILIAIACGLASAALFVSPLSLGGLGFGLSSFTAMPLFVSALGLGTLPGIISGAVATAVVAIFAGGYGALAVAAATLAPALYIGHLVGLVRNEDGVEEWYPLSGILVRMVAIAAAIALVIGYLSGYSQEWAVEQSKAIFTQLSDAGAQIDAAQVERQAQTIATLLPYALPASILLMLVVNLWFGMRFARARGWVLRPKDDIPATLALPVWAVAVYLAAIALSFTATDIGLIAKVAAGAFGAGFGLVGLASVHFLSRGLRGRGFMLGMTYFLLLVSRFFAFALSLLGVGETLLGLRSRYAARYPNP